MEPASTLASVALAVATILPGQPYIEVALSNWQNSRKEIVNIYECENPTKPGALIASLTPGHNETSVQLPLRKNFTLIQLVPMDHSPYWVDLTFVKRETIKECYFDIHATAKHKVSIFEERGYCIANKTIEWKPDNPPSYITVEIEGTVGQTWHNSQAQIKYEEIKRKLA